jgi:hypothetical protein
VEALVPKLLEQGALFTLAVLALYALNAVWNARLEEARQRIAEERKDKLRLAEVLDSNTAAITQLTAIVCELKDIVKQRR